MTYLQEARDVPLVIDTHGNHILEHPEEGPVLPLLRFGLTQQAVKLKEQPPCAFCVNQTVRSLSTAQTVFIFIKKCKKLTFK